MKPTMLFAIVLVTAIILASSFGLHIMPTDALYNLSADVSANALYVCPGADSVFDSISTGLRHAMRYIYMFYFGAWLILAFIWGWALYQNLLKDKFEQKAFENAWTFTKALFWIMVVVGVLAATPNHFRSVHVTGAPGSYVLCEENTPGALPVLSTAVKR